METGSKERWRLSQAAFDRLLAALSDDRTAAAEHYERIRARLIKFFTWERCPFPEDHADETINRVAKRVSEGEELQNASSYFYGAARMVLKEIITHQHRQSRAAEEFKRLPQFAEAPDEAEDRQASLECLTDCLARVTPEQQSFILQYYEGERGHRIENRKRMAEELQLPLNALRNRALRLREKMENCVSKCLTAKKRP